MQVLKGLVFIILLNNLLRTSEARSLQPSAFPVPCSRPWHYTLHTETALANHSHHQQFTFFCSWAPSGRLRNPTSPWTPATAGLLHSLHNLFHTRFIFRHSLKVSSKNVYVAGNLSSFLERHGEITCQLWWGVLLLCSTSPGLHIVSINSYVRQQQPPVQAQQSCQTSGYHRWWVETNGFSRGQEKEKPGCLQRTK